MADVIGRADYQVGADLGPLKRDLGDAEGGLKKTGNEADRTAKKVGGIKGALSGLKGGIVGGLGLGAGLGAFGLATAAIGGVTDALKGAVDAAKEEQAGIARLDGALKNNVAGWNGNREGVEEHISQLQKLSAFSDGELRDSMASLVTRTKSVEEAQRLQALAADIARARGISLAAATEAVGKAAQGQLGPLKKMGVEITAGMTSQEALNAAQQKFAGQAEAYGKSAQGAMESFQNAMGDVMEDIGSALLPVITTLALFARDTLLPAMSGIATVFGFIASVVGPPLVAAFTAVGTAVQALGQVIPGIFQGIQQAIGQVVGNVIGFFRQFVVAASSIPGVGENFKGLAADLLVAEQAARSWGTTTEQAAKETAATLVESTATYKDQLHGAAAAAEQSRDRHRAAFREWRQDYKNGVGDVTTASQQYAGAYTDLRRRIDTALDAAAKHARETGREIPQGIAEGIDASRDLVSNAIDNLRNLIANELDPAVEIGRLVGFLTGGELAQGLRSRDPVLRAAAEHAKSVAEGRLRELGVTAYGYGQSAGSQLARGLESKYGVVLASAKKLANAAGAALRVRSPAKEGPWSEGGGPEGWGRRFGELIATGIGSALPAMSRAAAAIAVQPGADSMTVRHVVQLDLRNAPAGVTNEGVARIVRPVLEGASRRSAFRQSVLMPIYR